MTSTPHSHPRPHYLLPLACTGLLAVFFSALVAIADDLPAEASWPRHKTHMVVPQEQWKVYLHPKLLEEQPEATRKMLALLDTQLKRVTTTVPDTALKQLQAVPIWINPPYEGISPKAEYHPDAQWLRAHKRDPEMAKCIEITNVAIFPREDVRMPYLLLHELSHAYHDQILGFDDPEIITAFKAAEKSGSYDSVKRFDGKSHRMDKAYAMTNAKEYFAETTEAFFGQNDFYPFNQSELKKHDPEMVKVLLKKWGVEP